MQRKTFARSYTVASNGHLQICGCIVGSVSVGNRNYVQNKSNLRPAPAPALACRKQVHGFECLASAVLHEMLGLDNALVYTSFSGTDARDLPS